VYLRFELSTSRCWANVYFFTYSLSLNLHGYYEYTIDATAKITNDFVFIITPEYVHNVSIKLKSD